MSDTMDLRAKAAAATPAEQAESALAAATERIAALEADVELWRDECQAAKESRDAACHERDATVQALEQAECRVAALAEDRNRCLDEKIAANRRGDAATERERALREERAPDGWHEALLEVLGLSDPQTWDAVLAAVKQQARLAAKAATYWNEREQAIHAQRELREALNAARDHMVTDRDMQQCDGTDSCWYCFCDNAIEQIDAALAACPPSAGTEPTTP